MRPSSPKSAFTLVEVLFASAILATAAIGGIWCAHHLSGFMLEKAEEATADVIGCNLVWEACNNYNYANLDKAVRSDEPYVVDGSSVSNQLPIAVFRSGGSVIPLKRLSEYGVPKYDCTIDVSESMIERNDHSFATGKWVRVTLKWGKGFARTHVNSNFYDKSEYGKWQKP